MSVLCFSRLSHYKNILHSKIEYCSIIPNDEDYDDSWYLESIEADKAWEITKGLKNVGVNVVDSGINYNPTLLPNFTELNNNIDLNNSLEVCYGSTEGPFFDYTSCLPEYHAHGTKVACLIGAEANNIEGSCGVAWDINLLSIKISSALSGINFSEVAKVFNSNDNNYRGYVPITNMSFGIPISYGENNNIYYTNHCDALLTALSSYSGLLVVAAGNDGSNIDQAINKFYPASFDISNMIVVGSSNQNDEKYYLSNYGANTVDLFAPGSQIIAPMFEVNNGNLVQMTNGYFSGTSAAAPLVSGTAALIKAVNPNLTALEIKSLILNNVDTNANLSVSGGRLNTYKAVKAAIPEIATFNSFINGIQPLPSNKQQFYKISLTPGTYTFETSGNLNTSGYLYRDIQSSPVVSSINQSGNFSLTYSTIKNCVVYLKIVNLSSNAGSYNVKVSSNHNHAYSDHYAYYDGYTHQAFCSCGQYSLKPHIAGPNYICLMCGGTYIGPLSNPLNKANIINNQSSQDDEGEENRALYNRIILDYYEQRFSKQKNKGMSIYHKSPYVYVEVGIEDIELYYIFVKTNNGAYILVESDKLHKIGMGAGYSMVYGYDFNGETVPYGDMYLPADVYYNGYIYYLPDAYYHGIITNDDVGSYFTISSMPLFDEAKKEKPYKMPFAHYDSEIAPLDIKKEKPDENSLFNKMCRDFYNLRIKDNEEFKEYDISLDDIHIFQSYAFINNVAAVTFSIDGVTPPRYLDEGKQKEWENPLTFSSLTIEKFQDYMPVIYTDGGFYFIDEAYDQQIIDEETAIAILEQYKKADYRSNETNCWNCI